MSANSTIAPPAEIRPTRKRISNTNTAMGIKTANTGAQLLKLRRHLFTALRNLRQGNQSFCSLKEKARPMVISYLLYPYLTIMHSPLTSSISRQETTNRQLLRRSQNDSPMLCGSANVGSGTYEIPPSTSFFIRSSIIAVMYGLVMAELNRLATISPVALF